MSTKHRVSPEEIKTDLGVSLTKVYQMLKDRTIPNIRAGKIYIVSRAAYTEWLRTCGTQAQTEVLQ